MRVWWKLDCVSSCVLSRVGVEFLAITSLTIIIMEIRKRLRAFTLIELLIVITIIGILAVALVPRITGGPAKARDATRKADLQQIATALEFYADDLGYYPGTGGTGQCVSATTEIASYLTSVPSDPSSSDSPGCSSGDYTYYPIKTTGSTTVDGYLLIASLESDTVTGDGIYDTDSYSSIVSTSSAATNMSTYLVLCSAADCTNNDGAMYVVGR